MPYRLSYDVWLANQIDKVRATLLHRMDHHTEYTLQELLALCAQVGLDYSNPDYVQIGQALITEGLLVPTPEP